jgi:hypothetical protein
MNIILAFLLSFFSGYAISLYTSHPAKKKHILPHIRLKNIEILPNFKISFRHTTIHIHHWFVYSIVAFFSFFLLEGLFIYFILKGLLIGAIVQGLRYEDRFNFRLRRT